MPLSVPPMLPKEVETLPQGEDWAYELLWGGERVRTIKYEEGVNVIARDGRDCTNRFPRVAAAVARLRARSAILDGEILHLDSCSRGAVEFLAQAADDILSSQTILLAYDYLYDEGVDVRPSSLLCRRLRLAAAVQGTPIVISPMMHGSAEHALEVATRLGMRGVVAKRSGSAYRPNSLCNDWVKVTLEPSGAGATPKRSPGARGRLPWLRRIGPLFGPGCLACFSARAVLSCMETGLAG